jgi:hypothetical protein
MNQKNEINRVRTDIKINEKEWYLEKHPTKAHTPVWC